MGNWYTSKAYELSAEHSKSFEECLSILIRATDIEYVHSYNRLIARSVAFNNLIKNFRHYYETENQRGYLWIF